MIVSHDLEEAVYVADRILLLTRAPTQVADFVSYDAPHPRTDETLAEANFIKVKSHCLSVFQREVRK
jgi:NitT/TauT family transport system ATP-binding protein